MSFGEMLLAGTVCVISFSIICIIGLEYFIL